MVWIGTSGYSYPEWRGSFYPADLSPAEMLSYYSARFDSVEINNTFYRLPTEKLLAGWAKETPSGFVLTLKAPQQITHKARLRDCQEVVDVFFARARTLGPKLGAILFQLPPWARKDVAVLEAFLETLPAGFRCAFEFRHSSWFSDEVYAALKAGNAALCIADSEKLRTPVVATADFGYFRLRDEGYMETDIAAWAKTVAGLAPSWKETYVYFKHEEEGIGPEFARKLRQHLADLLPKP